MGVRRGTWNAEVINKAAAVKSSRFGARPAVIVQAGSANSEIAMAKRNIAPDPLVVSGISDTRRESLIRGTETTGTNNYAPLVVYSNSYKRSQELREHFVKQAGINIGGGGFGSSGASTVRQGPEVYSPLFQIANLQLPRDRITMNAWNRNFYDTHPLVHNCINLHATYPINKINIKCKEQKVERFFSDWAEEIGLISFLQNIALEFWKMGEVFPYLELDANRGIWSNIYIQNPDYIHVKTSVMGGDPVISMRPDAALQRLVQSNNPADMQLRNQIDPEIIHHVRKGNNIPLDNFHVSHLMMKSAPYDIHGTSPIVSIYKDLMLYDKLRESKFAQADNLVNPITLVKVGGTAEGEYHPTQEALEQWRQTFEAAQYDKDFKIISHAGIDITRVGASGAIIDISGDMTFIMDNILHGLMVPKAVITQEGASFNSASVALEVLKQRYASFRAMMAQWLIRKVFAPISEIQGFYDYEGGEKKLIVPEVDWNQMVLYDVDNYINILNQLSNVQPGQIPKVSQQTLYRSLGLNLEEERRLVKEQMIHDAITQKEQMILNTLTLSALRALKPEDDVIEPTEAPLPGTPGAEEAGMPGGMGGGMMGGMPPMGGPMGGGPPMGGGGPMGGPPPPGGMGGPEGGPAAPPGGAPPPGPAPGGAPPAGP
jgi:hypothetical protein